MNKKGKKPSNTTMEMAEHSVTLHFKKPTEKNDDIDFSLVFLNMEQEEIEEISIRLRAHHSEMKKKHEEYKATIMRQSIRFLLEDIRKFLDRSSRKDKHMLLKIKIGDVFETFNKAVEIFKT